MRAIVIAAPRSGSGKTTITLGLMECLRRRGLKVAPFKVGPDFIDPGYHRLVTGRPSINLDGWICSPAFVRATFARHAAGADVAVVEGAMGLFDGAGGVLDEGSTAHVAKIIDAPVVLVVDAKGQSRSVAPLVKGFADFDPAVRLAGVIFNNVASDSHGRLLREAVESLRSGVRVFGCIPRDERLQIPSRHLGLVTADEHPLPPAFLDRLAALVKEHVDLGMLWGAGICHAELPFGEGPPPPAGSPVRIAVARDEAFCFVYEDNLRLLEEAGAEIATFSPLRDAALPAGVSGVYLPGGYPEIFAAMLAENGGMKEAIRAAVAAGMPVYAECGGFIYLSLGVEGGEGEEIAPLAGIYPARARMLARRKALGYREVELAADSVIGPAGTVVRGHEFHYSEMGEIPPAIERLYRVRRLGVDLGAEGYRRNNCLASYVHLHFGSNPGVAAAFVASCRKFESS